jgi:hypothetical protein
MYIMNVLMNVLMNQHKLTSSNFLEIGDKTMVGYFLNDLQPLTKSAKEDANMAGEWSSEEIKAVSVHLPDKQAQIVHVSVLMAMDFQ